jgi:hypothetical protein
MNTISQLIENPLLHDIHEHDKNLLLDHFPELKACTHRQFLSLRKYLHQTPQRFYKYSSYSSFFAWLTDQDKSRKINFTEFIRSYLKKSIS